VLLFAYIAISAMYKPSVAGSDAHASGTAAAGSLRNNPAR
jgi:hypothetical protein